MKNIIWLLVLFSPFAFADFHAYRVYKKLSPGELSIFNVTLRALSAVDRDILLDNQGASSVTAELRIFPIEGDENQGKSLICDFLAFPISKKWPVGMEQYTCKDMDNQENSPVRNFQFSPGISKKIYLVGKLITWKNQGQHAEVEYKVLKAR